MFNLLLKRRSSYVTAFFGFSLSIVLCISKSFARSLASTAEATLPTIPQELTTVTQKIPSAAVAASTLKTSAVDAPFSVPPTEFLIQTPYFCLTQTETLLLLGSLIGAFFLGRYWALLSQTTQNLVNEEKYRQVTTELLNANSMLAELQGQLLEKLTEEKVLQDDLISQFKKAVMLKVESYVAANTRIAVANAEEAEERMKAVVEGAIDLCTLLQQTKGLRTNPELSEAIKLYIEQAQVELQKVILLKNRVSTLTVMLSGTELEAAVKHAQQHVQMLLNSRLKEGKLPRLPGATVSLNSSTMKPSLSEAEDTSAEVAESTHNYPNKSSFDEATTMDTSDADYDIDNNLNLSSRQKNVNSNTLHEML